MTGSPGNHPHADRPNWQPAETIDEYLANCREGLETYSDRRVAKLMGWSRMKLYRVRSAQRLPDELFERLLAQDRVPSWRELANVAASLFDGAPVYDIEGECPHCGGPLRVRRRFRQSSAQIVSQYLSETAA